MKFNEINKYNYCVSRLIFILLLEHILIHLFMADKHFLTMFIPEFASQPGYTEIIIKTILLQNDIPRKIGV